MTPPHHLILSLSLLTVLPILYSLPAIPDPTTQPLQQFLPSSSPPLTIPANPEQSDLTACPLHLSEDLFRAIESACTGKHNSGKHHKSKCCPVLAAWLYSAYSNIALGNAGRSLETMSYGDLPQLPDDSETCVDALQKGLKTKGIELVKVNETCDVVYCYCGIRLHPLSCPSAFSVNETSGKLVGDHSVHRLERNCLRHGVNGCSNCLSSLSRLNEEKTRNTTVSEDRTSKMKSRDCDLMGLTWLLSKNRSAYIHTVSAVFGAIMKSTNGLNPQSCTLSSDGLPLAVDSTELNTYAGSTNMPYQRLAIAD
ncbi:putative GPI-anchored protein At4g28100 isoform X2 [Apium graveolens]|uniref:putative GPI-anchored protein At4g28100 isoform X2 n=1 Tax=Apium graveolens TaxID=4045 RepID=UPI003D7A5571